MKWHLSPAAILFLTSLGGYASGETGRDPTLIGSWKGLRDANGTCSFLSWKNTMDADGRFTVTFFRDAEQTNPKRTEHGTWSAENGQNEMKTDGEDTADVYSYKVIDHDTVHYVYATTQPDGACKEDYEFTERRIRQ